MATIATLEERLGVVTKAVGDAAKTNTNTQKFDALWDIERVIDAIPKVHLFVV
jgi:hypothetical protein